MRQIAVAVHIGVAIVGDQQVSAGAEYRAYSVNGTISIRLLVLLY